MARLMLHKCQGKELLGTENMYRVMNDDRLRKENLAYDGTGGVSAGNRAAGFIPAFCDTTTGRVEPSRRADGSLAATHLLTGLPEEWIESRGNGNQGLTIKATVIAGFLHAGTFYTRDQAARAVAVH